MAKLKNPLLSLRASGTLSHVLTFVTRHRRPIVEKTPKPFDARSEPQLAWRPMFKKCIDLWHLLSPGEKQSWESAARSKHMTGYAWFISQCLRPNPGIYLPLQGGSMTGNIDMDSNRIRRLPEPIAPLEAATKAYTDALEARYQIGARARHSVDQAIPDSSVTTVALNTTDYDTDDIHDDAVNNSRLTCKTAGKYVVTGNVEFLGRAGGDRKAYLFKGATSFGISTFFSPDAIEKTALVVVSIINLAVDEYVILRVWQSSGAPLDLFHFSLRSPSLAMQRIG